MGQNNKSSHLLPFNNVIQAPKSVALCQVDFHTEEVNLSIFHLEAEKNVNCSCNLIKQFVFFFVFFPAHNITIGCTVHISCFGMSHNFGCLSCTAFQLYSLITGTTGNHSSDSY